MKRKMAALLVTIIATFTMFGCDSGSVEETSTVKIDERETYTDNQLECVRSILFITHQYLRDEVSAHDAILYLEIYSPILAASEDSGLQLISSLTDKIVLDIEAIESDDEAMKLLNITKEDIQDSLDMINSIYENRNKG